MGTTAEKGQRVLQSIAEVQEGINNLGGSLTDQTPFKNFKAELDNIYNNLPKTDYEEGSNITLSNTLKGKLDFEDDIVGYGDTKQEIDLTENNLTSQSANDLTITVNADKSITINGTATANTTINILNNTSNNTPATERTLEAGTYQLTGCPSGSDSGTKFKLDVLRSGYIALLDSGSGDIKTLTSSQTYTYFRIQIFSGTVCNNLVFRPKLLKIPSPSYPQDIEVVRGKNRLDDSNLVLFNSNKYISTTNYSTQGKIAVKPNTTYTLAYKTSMLNDMGMWEFDSSNNKTAISYTPKGRDYYSIRVFTTLSTTKTMSFYAGSNDTYTSVEEFLQAKELMLLEGDYSSQSIPSYLPYNTIEVVERGKNLFDKNAVTPNAYINTSGALVTGAIGYSASDYIKVSTGDITWSATTGNGYSLSIYNSSKTFIRSVGRTSNSAMTIPINNGEEYIRFTLLTADLDITQIEEGSASTSFEPYQTPQTYQLSLGEYEFAGIGNYVDTIKYDVDEDKVYKNENIGKKEITSSTSITYDTTLTNVSRFRTSISDSENATGNNSAYCNIFINKDGFSLDEQHFYIFNKNMYFFMPNSIAQNLTQLQTWLNSHSMYALYRKTTPTKTEITTTLKDQIKALYNSHSFNGTTIIEIEGQLPLIIKVRALKGE